MRFVFAGDRDIAVWALDYLVSRGDLPVALLLPDRERATHASELRRLCGHLPKDLIFEGRAFREEAAVSALQALECDLVLGVHFPYIVPHEVLRVPRFGVLNLHPAYLPYNRGWHTPSWAILDDTPYGATLHFMDSGVDTGDIVHRKQILISPGDTADDLYGRVKRLELEVLTEAWPAIAAGDIERRPQPAEAGTAHKRAELFSPEVQELDPHEVRRVGDVLRTLRALTTNRTEEAAYFEADGRRFRVQVKIAEEPLRPKDKAADQGSAA